MAKYTLNLTGSSDNQVLINQNKTTKEHEDFGASVFIQGTFSSATAVVQVSPDNGTTKYTAKDVNGNDISVTAAGYYNFLLGVGNKTSEHITVYGQITGGDSNTDVDFILFDTVC